MTPDIARLIMFLGILAIIQGGIDYYIYRKYKNYLDVLENVQPFWKKTYIYVAVCMFLLLIGTTIERLSTGNNLATGHVFQIMIAIWYVPKYPLTIFLLLKDGIGLVITLFKKIKSNSIVTVDDSPSLERRKVLHTIGVSASILPFIITAQGVLHTIYDIETKEIELVLPGLSRNLDGIRLLQISDIHTGSYFGTGYLQEVVHIINKQKADIIAITGDYVNFDPDELQIYLPILRQLHAQIGIYGSLGNHDHYMTGIKHKQLCTMIRSTGIDLLINNARTLQINNADLIIAGTDNTGFNQKFGDLTQTFDGVSKEATSILMAHDPTYWKMEILDSGLADLTLSGHTHGGQIGIELLGEAYSPAQFVYEQWSGLYMQHDKYLYVNRGLGTVGPPIRVGIPPEITVITLRSPIA
jgi:predicted MPP superfamily phosphohydrolase